MTGAALIAITAVAWLLGYVFACWRWPFALCKKCHGAGTRMSPTRRAFRICRRCKGNGRRTRTGRRVFNYLRVLQQEGR